MPAPEQVAHELFHRSFEFLTSNIEHPGDCFHDRRRRERQHEEHQHQADSNVYNLRIEHSAPPEGQAAPLNLGAPTEHVQLTIDGQWGTGLADDDRIEISTTTEPLRLFRSPQSYFDVLREKMNWGEK